MIHGEINITIVNNNKKFNLVLTNLTYLLNYTQNRTELNRIKKEKKRGGGGGKGGKESPCAQLTSETHKFRVENLLCS